MQCLRQELFVTALLAFLWTSVVAYLPTFYMDEWCSTTLDFQVQGVESGRLLLRPPSRGLRFLNCYVFFKAPLGRRLSFRFKGFDIRSTRSNCNSDHLQIFDDTLLRVGLTGRMCNGGETPEGVYTTTGQQGAVRLMKRNSMDDQMELIVTLFHLSPCRGGEFQCDNAHCIAKQLYCNDYDNCGDGSDKCLLNAAGIAGVVIAVIVVIIIIVAIIAIVMYRRRHQNRHLGKVSRG